MPFNPYHLTVTATGFCPISQDVEVRSGIPVKVTSALECGVGVDDGEGAKQWRRPGRERLDVSHRYRPGQFEKLPLESQSSSLSSLVTLASPGVAADSNGLFHGLGDHASNSFSVDGQPITDQQSKVFSNQLPSNSVQSLEVISGAPPAEYGGKTAW